MKVYREFQISIPAIEGERTPETEQRAFVRAIAHLAASEGIRETEKIDLLIKALLRGLFEMQAASSGGGAIGLPDGTIGHVDMVALNNAVAIGRHVAALQQLLPAAQYPIGQLPEATRLTEALDAYGQWFTALSIRDFRTKSRARNQVR